MSEKLKIKNSDELLRLLDRLRNGEEIPLTSIDFNTITKVEVKVQGSYYNGEISSDLCYSLVNFHDNLLRLYCIAKYREENLTRLTDEDREKINLIFTVNEGCTLWGVDLNEVASNIATSIAKHTIDKMNSTELTACVILIILSLLGYRLYDRYCQKEEKKVEESSKSELINQTVKIAEQMNEMAKRGQEMFIEHLKTYKEPEKIEVSTDGNTNTLIFERDEINELTRRQRRKLDNDSKPREVEIESIKKSNDKYIVTCRLPKADYSFPINVDTSFIEKEETDLLFEAFRDNKPIFILADFKSYQGKIEKGNASSIMLELPIEE